MTARGAKLTVLLGGGGVGKTTLAAGYALALARSGRRVGILGVDPSRRLEDALAIRLSDRETEIAGSPGCFAAVLSPAESLRRWARESADQATCDRLFANALFPALADRLAAVTDVIAAIRVAEWLERDPSLDDLVVDTAPGMNAIELLRRPRRVAAFLDGDLVRWLRSAVDVGHGGARILHAGARIVLRGLSRVAGARLVGDFAELVELIDAPAKRMLERVETSRRAIEGGGRLLLVTTVRDDAARIATSMATSLEEVGLRAHATIVNRAVPPSLESELARIDLRDAGPLAPDAARVARYARAYAARQARTTSEIAPLAPACIHVPMVRGLGERGRLEALVALGDVVRAQLG